MAQLLQQPAITRQQRTMWLIRIRGGDNPEGEGKQEGNKTAEELAAEKEAKEKADKEAAEKAEKEKKPAAPEKYEFTPPEGGNWMPMLWLCLSRSPKSWD